jgi:hypothetical protein
VNSRALWLSGWLLACALLATACGESNRYFPFDKDVVFVDASWNASQLMIMLNGTAHGVTAECNGQRKVVDEQGNWTMTFPDVRMVDVSCRVDGVGSFRLRIDDLERLPSGVPRRSEAAVRLLSQCLRIDRDRGKVLFSTSEQDWVAKTAIRCPKKVFHFETRTWRKFATGDLVLTF